jgi:hypothetical protein
MFLLIRPSLVSARGAPISSLICAAADLARSLMVERNFGPMLGYFAAAFFSSSPIAFLGKRGMHLPIKLDSSTMSFRMRRNAR